MTNTEMAQIFTRIAGLMEIKGENLYKILAYRRAAESLTALGEDIQTVYQQGRLKEVPGVGKAIAEKIEEILTTGRLEFLERLEQEVPPTLLELLEVPDVGPKKVALFWRQAGVTNLTELGLAARAGKLRDLPGIGEKSEARIVAGLEALARRSKRMLLGTAYPIAQTWLAWIRDLPGVEAAEAAGSLRRWKATIGDLDIVVASREPGPIMEAFTHHAEIERILGQGENKSSVQLRSGPNIQLWIQPPER
ncbi:MAG: hypothetical protein GYA17_18405, partial [Chloroflexi bacterium]|nr:hypothetical protein [Chloroflexota bacterium]